MFGDQVIIPPTSQNPNISPNLDRGPNHDSSKKKVLLIGSLILLALMICVGIFFGFKSFLAQKSKSPKPEVLVPPLSTSTIPVFPNQELPQSATSTGATSTFSNIAIEYLSFADYYKAPNNQIEVGFSDYELPLNVKIDVLNYYDVSRKLNIDPVLEDLNNYGFAKINNPWLKEAPDFYSLYASLEQKQIPFLITSDFIIYYYQTILKKVYKDIEENIFYDNLWNINKELYNAAKNRYEARLASVGNINDSILEGERLEAAFFAVALELLKPAANQIAPAGTLDDKNKFVATELERFNFTTPPYLRDDVLQEVKLIREGKTILKSPVMLYKRDYKEFLVPIDYRDNARLNNFYLTTKWLNSNFPLNYRDANCSDCLLDKEDWRLAMIAASFISTDFSNLPELKNKWARIYKVMSYFNPLREDLNFVYYRDSLRSLFGENYKIEELFDDKNKDASANLQKLKNKLNTFEFSPFLGALSVSDPAVNYRRGFKMLVESYQPSDYIFSRLTYPTLDSYEGGNIQANNLTFCSLKSANRRCNGFALDIVNLIRPIENNDYFTENTLYTNYESAVNDLKNKLDADSVWHTSNYWSTLYFLKAYLNMPKNNLPLYNNTLAWEDREQALAASAWINMQLPLDKFSVNQSARSQNFNDFSRFNSDSYVEPNLDLLNELLANNAMMQKMFITLQIDQEVSSVMNYLQTANTNLMSLKEIVIKELKGQKLEKADNEIITNFAKQLTLEKNLISQKQLIIKFPNSKKDLKEDLSRLKLMVLIHADGEDKVFSVGPVWDYVESR